MSATTFDAPHPAGPPANLLDQMLLEPRPWVRTCRKLRGDQNDLARCPLNPVICPEVAGSRLAWFAGIGGRF
jgi:hypothetical protein